MAGRNPWGGTALPGSVCDYCLRAAPDGQRFLDYPTPLGPIPWCGCGTADARVEFFDECPTCGSERSWFSADAAPNDHLSSPFTGTCRSCRSVVGVWTVPQQAKRRTDLQRRETA